MKGTKESCTCEECRSACLNKPGWMSPEQFIKIAEFLKMTPKQAFQKYFAIDWWENYYSEEGDDPNERRAFVIAPATNNRSSGDYYTFNPNGVCVFYEHHRCSIHPVKPVECADAIHGPLDSEEWSKKRKLLADKWQSDEYKALIEEVLGGKPEGPLPSLADVFSHLLGLW